jgi:xanthine dehydrogenase YagR molybdenum-binding subunit
MNLFEMAMDELAYTADIDPLELRIRNYTDKDANSGQPHTSKELMAAYRQGAERFGWDRRSRQPGSMVDDSELVGWGMATGVWEAMMMETSARARLSANGDLEVSSATSDIGTGTYTVMSQVAADTLGVPLHQISVRLGDSDLPEAPVEGGSAAASSVGAAVQMACQALGAKLLKAGRAHHPALRSLKSRDVEFADGMVRAKSDPSRAVSFSDIMRAAHKQRLEAEATAKPAESNQARNCHSAVFAEVKVDRELNVVRVTRIVCAVAAGRIINPKTARSQILGGVVMGLGMALHEETAMDHRLGRFMTHNLADYHVPVHADMPEIEVIFVHEDDPDVSPLGTKGVGEIGVVGTAAAIANAIFHATGKRIRSLPITIDKLLQA